MKNSKIHKIAIVGRANVGKSTLFNRLVGRRYSITERVSGTTRDRVDAVVKKGNAAFELIDTGGFGVGPRDHISKMIKKQIETAIGNSDMLLFVCDITEGVTPQDEEMLPILRKSGKDIILVLNKLDNEKLRPRVNEFFEFGIEEVYPVSALHNIGISSLTDKLIERAGPSAESAEKPATAVKVAIAGRPNVGKSSFINKIINEERMIVHEEPGTTRDSVDIHLSRDAGHFIFIDTAGMRHKRKVKEAVDVYGLLRARDSVKRSDICLVMIDAYEGLARDDMRILELAEDFGKGCILIANKWDLVSHTDMSKYRDALIRKMRCIRNIPILFTSCKTGLNLEEVFRLIKVVDGNMKAKFSDEQLDGVLELVSKTNRIPLARAGRAIKLYGIRQKGASPPTFELFVNKPDFVTGDYTNCIKNILRDELGLKGAPIRVYFSRPAGKKY